MSVYRNYADDVLVKELVSLEQQVDSLKTMQRYVSSQIAVTTQQSITVTPYTITVPPDVSGFPDPIQYREFAGIFRFVSENPNKTAVGIIATRPTIGTGYPQLGSSSPLYNSRKWEAFLPSDSPHIIRFGTIWDMRQGGDLVVSLTTNVPGRFYLEGTYTVFMT